MIEEGEIPENALLSNDEIAVKAMRLGYQWHYPGPIGIQQILDESFSCDWKRRQIITELIVYHGLGCYADSNKSDLRIDIDAAKALQTDDPIGYMKKVKQESKRPMVKATNAIIGNNNSGNNQGRDFEVLPQSQPTTNPNQNNDRPKSTEVNVSKAQFIFWLFTAFTTGAAIAIAISNFLKK